MAVEKELKTRLQLRYDSLTAWETKNPKLKVGEVAIVTTGPAKDTSAVTPDSGAQHPLLMKVGDGTHLFNELTWVSALAADVHAWAKAAGLVVEKAANNEGNVVTGISWDSTNKKIVYTTASVATSSQFTGLENRVKAIEDTYATDAELAAAVEALNAAIALKADKTYVDAELAKKVDKTTFESFQTSNTKAISDAQAAAEATAKGYTDTREAAIKLAYEAYADQAEADAKAHAEEKASAAQSAAAADATSKANAAQAAAEATAAADATKKANAAEANAKQHAEQKVNDLANGAVKANTEAIAAINNAETGILAKAAADATSKANAAEANAKDYTNTREAAITKAYGEAIAAAKKEILTGDSTTELKEAYDTLVEIQAWIEGAGVNATELTEAIAAEAKLRSDADAELQGNINGVAADLAKVVAGTTTVGNADKLDNHDSSYFATADALAKVVDGTTVVAKATDANTLDGHDSAYFATASSVTDLNTSVGELIEDIKDGSVVAKVASSLDAAGIAQVKGIKVDNAGHADTADKATSDAAGNNIASTYQTKTDATNTLNSIKDGTITVGNADKLDNHDSTYFATAEALTNVVNGTTPVAKATNADNLGGVAAASYALQSWVTGEVNKVKITADIGLKVTADADGFNRKIEIDDSVVFVLNGGGAADFE